jgi:hypothetical protein
MRLAAMGTMAILVTGSGCTVVAVEDQAFSTRVGTFNADQWLTGGCTVSNYGTFGDAESDALAEPADTSHTPLSTLAMLLTPNTIDNPVKFIAHGSDGELTNTAALDSVGEGPAGRSGDVDPVLRQRPYWRW